MLLFWQATKLGPVSLDTIDHSAPLGIVVTGVARRFGEVHAVRDASLVARPGEVTALIGPNGSGKTTLMLMLASLLQPDAGSIRIEGHDPVTDPAAVRSVLGWMPDLLGSWSSLSVRAALELTARMYGLSKPAAAEKASQLIALVGLEPLAEAPTRVLSRGQKQKLSLARALSNDPRVLLLDEPASGLDPSARVELRILVRRLAEEGRTVLISSHVLAELDEMADSAVFLSEGVTASDESIQRTRSSGRPWRIKGTDARSLVAALAAIGQPAPELGLDRGEILVTLPSEQLAVALLAELVRGGAPISSFSPAVGDLEHTFLGLDSGHGTNDDDGRNRA